MHECVYILHYQLLVQAKTVTKMVFELVTQSACRHSHALHPGTLTLLMFRIVVYK